MDRCIVYLKTGKISIAEQILPRLAPNKYWCGPPLGFGLRLQALFLLRHQRVSRGRGPQIGAQL